MKLFWIFLIITANGTIGSAGAVHECFLPLSANLALILCKKRRWQAVDTVTIASEFVGPGYSSKQDNFPIIASEFVGLSTAGSKGNFPIMFYAEATSQAFLDLR